MGTFLRAVRFVDRLVIDTDFICGCFSLDYLLLVGTYVARMVALLELSQTRSSSAIYYLLWYGCKCFVVADVYRVTTFIS